MENGSGATRGPREQTEPGAKLPVAAGAGTRGGRRERSACDTRAGLRFFRRPSPHSAVYCSGCCQAQHSHTHTHTGDKSICVYVFVLRVPAGGRGRKGRRGRRRTAPSRDARVLTHKGKSYYSRR
uniref:Uncharacterized protein n=1 Tax=Plectus sambesii TaxID=2011161 RepID=A0A914VE62_9BILA